MQAFSSHMSRMNQQTQILAPGADHNPLLEEWGDPFGVPAFDRIKPDHFRPAFAHAFASHASEVAAISGNAAAPTFENTIAALEASGQALSRTLNVFILLAGTHSNDDLLAIEREVAPLRAKHWDGILMDAALFGRIDSLYRARDRLALSSEQRRVLERYYLKFVRAGAALDAGAKARLADINARLATLGTTFSQNVLADEQGYTLVLDGEDDLAGLPDFVCAAARAAAEQRGLAGKHVITISRSSVEPFLQFSARRDLREKVFRAWIARGDGGGPTDNKAIIAEMVALLADRDALQALVQAEGKNFALAPWDWRHYAEKLRKARCDIDEATIKPYLQLDRIIEAAFYTASRLFGLTFEGRNDVPVWHDDVRVWEVRDAPGRHRGLFFGDYFARPSKHSGAWMTKLRDQEMLRGDIHPLVVNVMNFSKAGEGEPTLLSVDDAKTLFHEFGHALHALLSGVTYPMIAGTSVLKDWSELPSQLYEHWLERPEILRQFARHYRTGEAMPEDQLRRLVAARTFNQGQATVEYVASALIDLDIHLRPETDQAFDIGGFEQATLARIGMPDEIVMRHRPAHFQHIFAGNSYAAAYYSYLWSEVLDSDAFAAFEETGDIFDSGTAKKLHDHVYAAGGSCDPAELYTAFRGRLPTADGLLKRRGLSKDAA